MNENDDERWITERFRAGDGFREIASAAIARGYERGKAEGAAERDWLTSQLANERTKSHDLATQVTMLRERLAATQPDVPSRLAALEQRVGELRDRADRLAVLVDGLRGTLERTRAEIETLRARVGGARWLLATAHITESLTPKGWLNKRSAWLDADIRARGEVPR